MKRERIKQALSAKDFKAAEDLWMDAIADSVSPAFASFTLEAFMAANKSDSAETMGWALLDAHKNAAPEKQLDLAKAVLLAVPASEELRKITAELYRKVNSGRENFDMLWKASDLEGKQRPQRALRTLDTCLAIKPGCYMANRYNNTVIRIERLNPMDEYEFTGDADGSLDPKKLADEYEVLGNDDFRVMQRVDQQGMADAFSKDPLKAMVAICKSRGGQVDTEVLRDILTAGLIPEDKWSNWWSRARSAVRKSANLTIEGKNPSMVVLHEHALTLEDELAPVRAAARSPKEFFDLLKTYHSEAAKRSVDVQADFVDDIVATLAGMAKQFSQNCPADALEATLMIDHAVKLGAKVPTNCPTTQQLIGSQKNAAAMIVKLEDTVLQKDAFDALSQRADAADQFEKLMLISPSDVLDDIAGRLENMGRHDAAAQAINIALNDPLEYTQIIIWLWGKPKVKIADLPPHSTLLVKLLEVLNDIDHRLVASLEEKKTRRQAIRAALSASKFKIYNETIDGMDEAMASVIKTKIDRLHNMAVTMYDAMMGKIRENHFALFVKKKIEPWLDETVIWTTQAAYEARGHELNHIKEVLMPANAKQIGLAAEQGDLRENADWQAAIEERDMLVARVRKINAEIAMARILERSDVPRDSVGIGAKVTLRNTDGGELNELTFLGPWDSNPEAKIYSYTTKLAQYVMGLGMGEKVELDFEGETREYEIAGIEPAI